MGERLLIFMFPVDCSLHSIYFESVTWDDLTNGFEHVPGGNTYRNRSVLSYHFYKPPNVRKHFLYIQCKLGQHPQPSACFPERYV